MSHDKYLGIWMDYAHANLMEFTNDLIKTTTIIAPFTHDVKAESLEKSEQLMHNKEQQEKKSYFKRLEAFILKYESVLLFGPTEAKTELYNLIKADQRFVKIDISVLPADKMTENQQHAFLKEYFTKHTLIHLNSN